MMVTRWHLLAVVGTLVTSLVLPALSADSSKEHKPVIAALKADESLEHVDVFAGIEQGMLEVKLIPQDAMGGNILIENKGAKPLNVDFPPAFIGKQVLKQAPAQQPNNGNGLNGLANLTGQAGGGSQVQGGGIGNGNGNGAAGNNPGAGGPGNRNGFFSVPTDRIVRVAYRSVCLEHGKPDPSPRMTYRLGKVEEFSDDPVLAETLKIVASGEHDLQAGQAAAWHVANKMSWKKLGEKTIQHIGNPATRYFTKETLSRAQKLHETAVARVKEQAANALKTAKVAEESASPEAIVKRD
ncbi:MAG: hypothetical protein IAG10_33345 [Planctomycetaceae bacterium]|nr:hypothetical protein [Planctomycetaceae bacterium]